MPESGQALIEQKAEVIVLLLKRGLSTHAGKLALTSKSLMIEVGKRELNGMHPVQFMETVLTGEG